jgi:hypothetical protein
LGAGVFFCFHPFEKLKVFSKTQNGQKPFCGIIFIKEKWVKEYANSKN